MSRIAVAALLAAVLSVPALAQLTLVAPNGYATTEGASNNAFPWNRLAASMRFQQIYDSSHFTAQSANYPMVISRVRFRANAVAATTSWTGGTWPNVRIDMSTAAVDYLAPSTNMPSNHGPDLATVYTGPVSVIPGAGNGATVPGPWYVDIVLATPFTYDPRSGNDLVFEVYLDGTGWTGASTQTDAISGIAALPTPPLGTRVYDASGITGTTGTIGLHHMLATEFTYVPGPGLWAAFSATPESGTSPLQVQFNNQSVTDAPGGITSYAWDVNGDTVIDYTTQNPTHTYSACGSYSVSLTVTDATHAPNTLTRSNYIVTDTVTPGFTWNLIAPRTLQFTDTSVPTPTAWAWDLDGDNVTDSTVQNPAWVYPTGCAQGPNVTLNVNRLCRGPFSLTQRPFIASSLATIRDGNTSTSTGAGSYFDVNVLNPLGVSICVMEMKTTVAANAAVTFNVFVAPLTWVGNNTNLGAWRQVATGNTTGAPGANDLEVVTFNPPFYLPAGSHGVHVQVVASSPQYTAVTGTWSNADMSITTGAVGVLGTGGIIGRTWNGVFHYGTCASSGEAGYGFFGPGCTGALGIPRNTASALPRIGQTLTVDLTNLPQSLAFFMLGFSRTASGFGPLPLNMTPFGAPGCFGRVSPDSVLVLAGAANAVAFNLPIPNNAGLLCLQVYTQALALDPAANMLGAVASDAAALIVGQ